MSHTVNPPVVVNHPEYGELTIFAVDNDIVHSLLPYADVLEMDVRNVRYLIEDQKILLTADQAEKLGIQEI